MKSLDTRKILVLAGFVLIGVLWQVITLFAGHYPITNYPPKGTTIVALGDSLTVGVGASDTAHGYISILAKRLNITIANKGVSGDTTADAEKRLQRDVLDEHPNIVLILLGGNDYLKQVPQEETFRNLRSIIERTQKTGATVLLIGVRGGLLHDKFDKDFEKLAKDTGSLFVPNALNEILGDPKLMSDQVHPNDDGYLKIADKIAPTLEGLVLAAPQKTE